MKFPASLADHSRLTGNAAAIAAGLLQDSLHGEEDPMLYSCHHVYERVVK
jgi:hypothetical protein